jgi:UDP-3-O-[3-hydroxymyristoyl] glucosamine N-acyltransferase
MKRISVADVKRTLESHGLEGAHRGGNPPILGIKAVENSGPGDLVFASSAEFVGVVGERSPAAVVTSRECAELFDATDDFAVLDVGNVKLAHALIKQAFAGRDFKDGQWGRIHPSAVIHDSAKIDEAAMIGPGVVIGQGVRIGANCRILAGAVIENDAVLGDGCIVHPNAVVGYGCLLGDEVEIGAGSVIGSEGFGFAQDSKGRSHKIPQTGTVVIEDHVRIGACNCIDRATYGETRIGAGTKTDNICHFAHNVEIGQDCLFTPMLAVAGSTKIGNRVVSSGQTEVSDHITICDDVWLVHRAGVTQDITEPGWYAGLPVQPFKQYMKNTAQFRKLDDLKRKLVALSREFRQAR